MEKTGDHKRCFVISPIGPEDSDVRRHVDEVFKHLIEPALKQCGIAPVRSDHMNQPGKISEQMFRAIFEYDMCVAVLTFANPNVYYELAVAQSAGRPVVILIDRGERLPFDLKDFRTLSYDLTITSFTARTYIDRLVAAIQELDRVGWKGDDVFRSYRDGSTEATPNTPSIDALVTRETDERKFMRSAEEQLWLTQETGNLLAEKAKAELISFLRHGGSVFATCTAPTAGVARMMSFRNANLSSEAILKRSSLAQDHLANILANAGRYAERLSVRYTPFPIGCTLVIADPHHSDIRRRTGIIRLAGFRVPFAEKLDIELSGAMAPLTFDHFASEAKRQFMFASKVIFVTGPPRSGKTTLLSKLIEAFNDDSLFYLLTPALWQDRERTGFEYRLSTREAAVHFADRQADGSYVVKSDSLESMVCEINDAHQAGKVLLLDEIGPLQLRTPEFRSCIQAIVDDPRTSLVASLAQPEQCPDRMRPFVESLVRHPRSTLIHLQQNENEDALRQALQEEIAAALALARHVPRREWG